jgi:hypothetical protein
MTNVLEDLVEEMLFLEPVTSVEYEKFKQEYIAKLEAYAKDYALSVIGENEEAHLYGSSEQLAMNDADEFENDLAIARNHLRKEQRARVAG